MYVFGLKNHLANSFVSLLNGQTVRIYKGVAPTASNYSEASSASDLLGERSISLSVLELNSITTSVKHDVTPTASGTAAWFAIENTTTGEVLISDIGDITNTTASMILSTTNIISGVVFSIEDLELTFVDRLEV